MRNKFWLPTVVAQAVTIAMTGPLALAVVAILPGTPTQPRVEEAIGAVGALIPTVVGAWWLYRKLRVRLTEREARKAAFAFGWFTPVSLVVAIVLAQIPGGLADAILGPRFALVGALVGFVAVTDLLSFAAVAFTIWILGRERRLQSSNTD